MARALNEADSSKKKLTVEGQDLTRQIEDAEAYIAELGKTKISLTTQVGVGRDILPLLMQTGYVSVENVKRYFAPALSFSDVFLGSFLNILEREFVHVKQENANVFSTARRHEEARRRRGEGPCNFDEQVQEPLI